MHRYKARDVMEPITKTLRPTDTLKEAVRTMLVASRKPELRGSKGLLVVDDGKLIGMVSIKDILRAIMPSYMLQDATLGEFAWPGMLEDMARLASSMSVRHIMSVNLHTVPPEAPLMQCAALILEHNLWRLPVVDPDNRPLGQVYVRDIHYAIVSAIFGEDI